VLIKAVKEFLTAEEGAELDDRMGFIQAKSAPIRRKVLKALEESEEAFIRAYFCHQGRKSYLAIPDLELLEGRPDLAVRHKYYAAYCAWAGSDPDNRAEFLSMTSAEAYETHWNLSFADARAAFARGRPQDSISFLLVMRNPVHIEGALNSWKGKLALLEMTAEEAAPFFEKERKRGGLFHEFPVRRALNDGLRLIHLGRPDLARLYVAELRKIAGRGTKSPDGIRHDLYAAELNSLDLLHQAGLAGDRESAMRLAALGMADQVRSFVDQYSVRNFDFAYVGLDRAIATGIHYEFDPKWARDVCGPFLPQARAQRHYPIIFKAHEWNAWHPAPPPPRALPPEVAIPLIREVRAVAAKEEMERRTRGPRGPRH